MHPGSRRCTHTSGGHAACSVACYARRDARQSKAAAHGDVPGSAAGAGPSGCGDRRRRVVHLAATRPQHALACGALHGESEPAFHRGRGGPGGWLILVEPELHLGPDILVPDIAGWRRERVPTLPEEPHFSLAPDWLCEVLSPSTGWLDRLEEAARLRARERCARAGSWIRCSGHSRCCIWSRDAGRSRDSWAETSWFASRPSRPSKSSCDGSGRSQRSPDPSSGPVAFIDGASGVAPRNRSLSKATGEALHELGVNAPTSPESSNPSATNGAALSDRGWTQS